MDLNDNYSGESRNSGTTSSQQSFTLASESEFEFDSRKGSDVSNESGNSRGEAAISRRETTGESLPKYFVVRYLGKRDAGGLWGVRYTRKPVDTMVADAKTSTEQLPILELKVYDQGMRVCPATKNQNSKAINGLFQIKSISYGVQDFVYTRVVAIIVVRETTNVLEQHPFSCHAFACESTETAQRLMRALATAFNLFSKTDEAKNLQKGKTNFAIDLRPPKNLQAEMKDSDDSEV